MSTRKLHTHSGFTLVEILIVAAILAILVTVAIPNMLRARMNANESAAIENLRLIAQAQHAYFHDHQRYGSFEELSPIPESVQSGYTSSDWTQDAVRSGYRYRMEEADEEAFLCIAAPTTLGGRRYFRIDATGIIRHNPDEAPTADDPGIGT